MKQLPRPLSKPGPLLKYFELLGRSDHTARELDLIVASIKATLQTDGGKLLLELLEVSTSYPILHHSDDPRALAAKEAQRFIASDLIRIASDEHEQISSRLERT